MRGAFWIAAALVAITFAGCARRHSGTEVVQEQYVHKYGIEVPKEDWASRGRAGQVISTQKDGVIVRKNYHAGLLDGETTFSFPRSDRVQKKEIYQMGVLVKEIMHYPSGQPEREIAYLSPTTREATFWYEEGTPQSREEYEGDLLMAGEYYAKNNQLESKIDGGSGERVHRDQFGQIVSKDTFESGVMVERTAFYPNGAPKESVCYNNGKMHGLRTCFHAGGEPEIVENYFEDYREGISTHFHNGEKASETPYARGKKNGVERRYRNGDELVEEISWREDRRHGPSTLHVRGNKDVEWYLDGKKVNKVQYDRYHRTVIPNEIQKTGI